jgi:hypothetical protein
MPIKGVCTSLNADESTTTNNQVQRVRVDVTTTMGYTRHLLLAFTPDNAATDGLDYGYDAVNSDSYSNDSSWMVGEHHCVIQGVGAFHPSKTYPLGLFLSDSGTIEISLTALEHFDQDVEVYIYDALNNTVTSISNANLIETMPEGNSTNRFYITFTNSVSAMDFSNSALSTSDTQLNTPQINYISSINELQIHMPNGLNVNDIHLYNILGQKVKQWSHLIPDSSGNYTISLSNISKGTYLISLITKTGKFNKRLVISK